MSQSKNLYCRSGSLVFICLALSGVLAFGQSSKTIVRYPVGHAVSKPLRELPIDVLGLGDVEAPEPKPLPMSLRGGNGPAKPDPVLQKDIRPNVSATKGIDFDGIGANGFAPSDVNLAIGPNHIVQTVNVRLAVYNKSGALLSGPTNFTTFFAPVGGACAAGASDPIVNYDRLADRWVISDIGISGTFSECVAVSKTNDPTGAYTLYNFSFGTNLNDYPKLGVWPTATNGAYLATYNIFTNGQFFAGSQLCGFDRTKMLAGNAGAAQLCKQTPNSEGGYLPADLDGPTPPTDGTPGLFVTWQNNNPGQLFLRKLTLDFAAGTSVMSAATTINVANTSLACGNGGTCVPQKGTAQTLDTLGDRLMYRMPYRKFADHERVMLNHSVANGAQVAVRWYEILDLSTAPVVNQQATFAPDTTFRWMASAAMDKSNDIAIGYSASSSTINPAIRFTGRVPGDPLNTLETEASILEGTGSQTSGLSRWGDYTALQVDPSDDCTFWYTNQYQKVNGTFNWSSHIGAFVFPTCGGGGGGAVVSLSTTALNFKKEPIGQTTAPQTVTLTNTGTATLNISSITASGDYHISNNTCGATVNAGANCAVSVTFTPTKKGKRTGTLSFTDDAPGSPQTVSLTGVGQSIAVSPTSLNFGTVKVGNTSAAQNVTVSNVGTTTVTFTGFTITGKIADYGISANTCGATIAPGANCTVSVVFHPTGIGTRNAKLNVKNNGGGSPSVTTLTGVGN